MRQNPIQKLRGGMNLKHRVTQPNLHPTPQEPVVPVVPQTPVSTVPVPTVPQPAAPIVAPTVVQQIPILSAPIQSAPTVPSVSAPVADEKQGLYDIPTIFISLLSGSKREILPLLKSGLEKAKEMKDDLHTAIFEGGIAANLPTPDTKKATEAFHRAFDLSEKRKGESNVFLHGMVWNLCTKLGNNAETAGLMERAQKVMQNVEEVKDRAEEQLSEVFGEFEKLPGFKQVFDDVQKLRGRQTDSVVEKLKRASKLDHTKSFLFFTRPGGNEDGERTTPSSILSESAGNYLVVNKGFGTVIDPDSTFVDDLYQIGGTLRDLRNVVFTTASPETDDAMNQFRTFFERLGHRGGVPSIRFFVTQSTASKSQIAQLNCSGAAESVVVLNGNAALDLLGGGSLKFRYGSVLLTLPGGKTLQFVAQKNADHAPAPDDLVENADYMVVPVDTPEELVLSARLIRELRPKQIVFDYIGKSGMSRFADSVRLYLQASTMIPHATASLVFDISNGKFLDMVKAFSQSEKDCWTENAKLAFTQGPDPIFYEEGHAAEDEREVIESFLYNRRRCRGLYFK